MPSTCAANVVAVERVDVQAIEERSGWRHALRFVVDRPDPAVAEGGRGRLAQVVAHGAEHDRELLRSRQIVDARARLVDHLQGVHPHVAFGMPLRLLRTADQRVQFRQQTFDDAEVECEGEADGRLRCEQQLLELAPDALGRQVVERNGAADGACLLVERQLEASRELHGTQHAQAVVGEGARIDDAQQAALEIGAPVERIDVVAVSADRTRWR